MLVSRFLKESGRRKSFWESFGKGVVDVRKIFLGIEVKMLRRSLEELGNFRGVVNLEIGRLDQ